MPSTPGSSRYGSDVTRNATALTRNRRFLPMTSVNFAVKKRATMAPMTKAPLASPASASPEENSFRAYRAMMAT